MTKLAHARVKARLTQFDVATGAGMSEQAYGRLERAERNEVSVRELWKLSRVLRCRPEELLEDHWIE
jgi:transcriptional regulator with XRE-family HTH domain